MDELAERLVPQIEAGCVFVNELVERHFLLPMDSQGVIEGLLTAPLVEVRFLGIATVKTLPNE